MIRRSDIWGWICWDWFVGVLGGGGGDCWRVEEGVEFVVLRGKCDLGGVGWGGMLGYDCLWKGGEEVIRELLLFLLVRGCGRLGVFFLGGV